MTGGYLHSASEWIVTEPRERLLSGPHGFITETELRYLHKRYTTEECSIFKLVEGYWAKRYATQAIAANKVLLGWQRLGLPRRDRLDAVRIALKQRRGEDAPPRKDTAAYFRWYRSKKGKRARRRHLNARRTPKRVAL